MSDGHWEAVRGSHRDAQGDPDSEHAAAAAESRPAGSRLRESTEVVVGWRAWGVASQIPSYLRSETSDPLVLTSTFMVNVWPPGRAMTACCGTKFLRHGIHAFGRREHAEAYVGTGRQAWYVYGEVSLWGRVVIHEHGYRAEFAYPKRIFVPQRYQGGRDLVNELRRSYGVEVEWTARAS
jgi:hypothetical protein